MSTSLLDGLLLHCRVYTLSVKFTGTHLYTLVERGSMDIKYLAQKHNIMSLTRAWPWGNHASHNKHKWQNLFITDQKAHCSKGDYVPYRNTIWYSAQREFRGWLGQLPFEQVKLFEQNSSSRTTVRDQIIVSVLRWLPIAFWPRASWFQKSRDGVSFQTLRQSRVRNHAVKCRQTWRPTF